MRIGTLIGTALGGLAVASVQAALPVASGAAPPGAAPARARALPTASAATPRPEALPADFRIVIDCRIRQFIVLLAADRPLLLDGTQALPLVASASDPGQRFESMTDPSTFVHAEGSQATVALRDVRYANCSLLR